jgi:hypothetical protein
MREFCNFHALFLDLEKVASRARTTTPRVVTRQRLVLRLDVGAFSDGGSAAGRERRDFCGLVTRNESDEHGSQARMNLP